MKEPFILTLESIRRLERFVVRADNRALLHGLDAIRYLRQANSISREEGIKLACEMLETLGRKSSLCHQYLQNLLAQSSKPQ